MRRDSWLDRIVFNFQHRWETNAQYRATVSGVVGLLLIVAMCSCTGIVSALANGALASVGLGTGSGPTTNQGSGILNTGTNPITGAKQFAIPTQVWTPGVVPPASPIPNSQTPAPTATSAPTPTDTPTPTPCTSNCGGGGGGGGGYSVTVTASITPSPLVGGQQATIHIQTSVPNDGVGFLITGHNGGTQTYEPAGTTDASGNFSMSFTAPSCQGSANILVFADGSAAPGVPGYSFSPPCN
ncbi:MAG: hypothetical protein ACXWQR_09825 [Ktedonobacterales bacterium]